MTPVDFVFTMSKVKVTRVTFVIQCKNGVLRTIYHRAIIFYVMIGFHQNMTTIDSEFIRSKVKVTMFMFVQNGFRLGPTILRIIQLSAFIFHMLISLIDSIDIEFTWSKVKVIRIKFVKKTVNIVLTYYLENCLSQGFHVSHANWYWL